MKQVAAFMISITFLATPLLAGELTYTMDNSIGKADYLLGSILVTDASYSASTFSLSSILSDKSRAYVELSHTQIYPDADYSNSDGELGLQMRYLDIKDHQIFAGLYAFFNRYHANYSYYNASGFGMYLKWKYYLKTTQLFIGGYDLNFNRFEEVAEASNTDHEIYLTYNQSFRTKSAVNIRTALAYQNFWPQTVVLDQSPGRFTHSVEVDSIPDNYLYITEIRFSQTIGPKLGATLWLDYQGLIDNNSNDLALQDGLNNPFIDRFRSEGGTASIRLLYRINGKQRFKFTTLLQEKQFQNVPVYEFDLENMSYTIENNAYVDLGYDRQDRKSKTQVTWSLDLGQSKSDLFPALELMLNMGWTQNISNDPLYDYESMNYGITINMNN